MYDSRVCRALAAAAPVVCALLCAPLGARAEVVSLAGEAYASLSGYVYIDLNLTREMEEGELVIPDVAIILEGISDEGESVRETTLTEENGAYSFTGIEPGTYSLIEDPPVEFIPGPANDPGTIEGKPVGHPDCGEADGPSKFTNIKLDAGDVGTMYNFGKAGLRSAYVSKRHFLSYHPEEEPPEDIPEPGGATLMVFGALVLLHAFGRRQRSEEIDRGR
jgi:hypothetical protein